MEIKKIGSLPVLSGVTGSENVLIEDGGYAKRVPVNAFAGANNTDAAAYGIPVLKMTGDVSGMSKDNAVTLDYTYGDKAGSLTCKWQGSSSLAYPKKNFTVVFDEVFEAKEGWGAHDKYCLKANFIDASNMRNILGAKLWGEIVKIRTDASDKLKGLINGGAIDGFPVWVEINGAAQGLYTFNIPKDAWMLGMTGESDAEGFVCAENCALDTAVTGDGTDVKIEYAAGDTAALIASLNNLITVINEANTSGDTAALEAVVDVQSVIDYFCIMAHFLHKDGISKNWILATYDGVKWLMSAYDMDATFGNNWHGKTYLWANDWPMFGNGDASDYPINANALLYVVRKYYAAEIKARYQKLRNWVLGDLNVNGTTTNLAAQFPRALADEDFRLWPGRPGTGVNDVHQILEWQRLRGISLDWNVQSIV